MKKRLQLWPVRIPTLLAMWWRMRVRKPLVTGVERTGARSFIVFRLDSLGDVVMTTPLFRALKAAFPKSRCTAVVQRNYKALLATNPHIDEILTLPNVRPEWLPQRLRKLLAALWLYQTELRKRHFDFAISPRWDTDEHLATLLCVLSNAATRVGYSETATAAKRKMNRGFDRAFDICLPPGPPRHEVLRNLAIAEALGATACDTRPEVRVTERDRRHADELLVKVPRSAKLVSLGIGAQSPGRRWPLERYAETLAALETVHRMWPVIVCSSAEFGDALKLAETLRRPPVIVSGAPLRQVCAVLERCELFIGNDSGCAHLAAAMGCRTVVISRHPGGGDPNHFNSPVRFSPQGRQVRVLQPASGADECRAACSHLEPHCIKLVSPEEVAAVAHEMLAQPAVLAPVVASKWPPRIRPVLLDSHSADGLLKAMEALHPTAAQPPL